MNRGTREGLLSGKGAAMPSERRHNDATARRRTDEAADVLAFADYQAADSIALLMRVALFGLRAAFKAELAKHRVPWSVWYYLRVLWEHDGISQRELTDRVGFMQPNTVSALQTMQKAGWVRVTRGADRRSTIVSLTQKGRRLMQRMLPGIRAAMQPLLLDGFSDGDEAELRRLLNKVCDNVGRARPRDITLGDGP